MAEYCRQCSIRILGPSAAKYAGGLCKPGEIVEMLCEGCGGYVEVDHLGVLVERGMIIRAIVAGTGHDKRDQYIRRFASEGMRVVLRREPNNPYDHNAIAVDMMVKRWYTLFKEVPVHIGYIKKRRAASMAVQMDVGGKIISSRVSSLFLEQNHPRVSLEIETSWTGGSDG